MIDQNNPRPADGGATEAHAAYYERRASDLSKLAIRAISEGDFKAWAHRTYYASIAARVAREIRARLAAARPAQHETDCPLGNCRTCQEPRPDEVVIASSAASIARGIDFDQAVLEVCSWLQKSNPLAWAFADAAKVTALAHSLIHLRDQVEAGRWKRG